MYVTGERKGMRRIPDWREGEEILDSACNPSYSGSRDQEDCSSKPTLSNSWQDPILKKTHHKKRACRVAQGEGPEFKPQYCKKRKKILYSVSQFPHKSQEFEIHHPHIFEGLHKKRETYKVEV
jgi:hypothetical protein